MELVYFKALLKDRGYKFTPQKQLILNLLLRCKIHLSIEDIYNTLKTQSISLPTIYRSLKVLKETNIIKEINIEGKKYYEMKLFSKKPLHIHLKCIQCNSIIDIDNLSLTLYYLRLINNIEREYNYTIADTDVILYGLCPKCKEDNNGKTY